MSSITAPLAKAGSPVFAISTWCVLTPWLIELGGDPVSLCRNTDYVLIPKEKVDVAQKALSEDGWKFA